MITMDKIYRTRDGRKARVLATDVKRSDRPVAVAIAQDDGMEDVFVHTPTGAYFTKGSESPNDLIEYNPAQDLVLDQPIWVREDHNSPWVREGHNSPWMPRHFAELTPAGRVVCFDGGRTSHTRECNGTTSWPHWSATKPEGTV